MGITTTCSTCEFHSQYGIREWICSNDDSDNFGLETTPNETCSEHVMREEIRDGNKERF